MYDKFFRHISKPFLAICIVIVGVSLYVPSFANQMFWDDNDFILNNRYIKEWQYFPQMFTGNVIEGAGLVSNYYRPVLLVVFSLEWRAFGSAVYGWHAVNTLFHAANAVLLFYLVTLLWKRKWLAFIAAVLFLVHPLQTEAITYVNSLGDALSVFFMLSGLLLYYKYYKSQKPAHRSIWYYGALVVFPLALLSKETAIIMPALIFLIDFFLTDITAFWLRIWLAIKRTWPYFLVAGSYVLLRGTALNFQNTFNLYNESNTFTENILFRIFTFFRIIWTYLGLLFLPKDLHMERTVHVATSLLSFDVLAGLAICAILIAVAVWQYRKRPIVSFGIVWFFVCLAPTSNIAVPINGLLYEHWLYLAQFGFWLAVLSILGYLVQSITRERVQKFVGASVFGMLFIAIILFSARTVLRNRDWKNPITLYTQTLKFAPQSYRVWNNLGMSYADIGQTAQAIVSYQTAVVLDESNPVALHNLGNAYQSLGEASTAQTYYESALKADPNFSYSFNNLVNLYIRQNELAKARQLLERYAPKSENGREFYDLLVELAVSEKDYAGAIRYLDQAMAAYPNDPKNTDRAYYREELLKQLPRS